MMVIQITPSFIQWLIDEELAATPDDAQALAERIAEQLYFTGAFRQTPAEQAAPALLAACKAALTCVARLTPFPVEEAGPELSNAIQKAGDYADEVRAQLRAAIAAAEGE